MTETERIAVALERIADTLAELVTIAHAIVVADDIRAEALGEITGIVTVTEAAQRPARA